MRETYRIGVFLLLGLAPGVVGAATVKTLIDVVKDGDKAAARVLVQQEKADVNLPGPDGSTALHWAVFRDDVEMVDLLVRAGAHAVTENRYGATPLELAATNGNADIVARLLDAGADANALGAAGAPSLVIAARTGNVPALKVLLAHGALVDGRQQDTGQTALMWAAAENNVPAMQALIAAGAEIDAYSGFTPVQKTNTKEPLVARSKVQRLELLARGGSIPKIKSVAQLTALHFAVRKGRIEAASALLAAGADVNRPAASGMSPLGLAIVNAHYELASLLIDRGADVNYDGDGITALMHVVRMRAPTIKSTNPVPTGHTSTIDLAKKLLQKGANPNARMGSADFADGIRNRVNWLGATPFFAAAKAVDVDMMRLLLESGANPSIPNVDQVTPLAVAAGVGVWNAGEDYGTAPADEPQALVAVKFLVEETGADVNATDLSGERPMHGAAYTGRNSVVQYLADKGAPLDPRNAVGWTPLRIADGVNYSAFSKQAPQTARYIRTLLAERGLPVPKDEGVINAEEGFGLTSFAEKVETLEGVEIDDATKIALEVRKAKLAAEKKQKEEQKQQKPKP